MEFKKFASFWLLLATLQCVYSLDLESAKEGLKCFEPKTVPSDLSWVMSVKNWYYVAMSRLDLYVSSAHMTGRDLKDIREDEIYYDSCVSWSANSAGDAMVAHGFHGKTKSYEIEPLDDTFAKTKFVGADGRLPGTMYTVLTDNKTFSLYLTCLHDFEEMIWTLASTQKNPPKETIKLVHDHVESLGFKREYFTGQRFDYCEDDEEAVVEKDEL